MRIAYTESNVDLLARLMRAEAEGEGQQGGNYSFEAVTKGYFYQRTREIQRFILFGFSIP